MQVSMLPGLITLYTVHSKASGPSTWCHALGGVEGGVGSRGNTKNVGTSIYNCRPLCRGYSVFIASLKLFWVWGMEKTRQQITGHLPAMAALSNGAWALISTAASQHVSAVWVKFKEVVYSETDLQNGASPFHVPATSWGQHPAH